MMEHIFTAFNGNEGKRMFLIETEVLKGNPLNFDIFGDRFRYVPELTCKNVASDYDKMSNAFKCSECGTYIRDAEDYWIEIELPGDSDKEPGWNYCPVCGRKVVE